MNNQDLILRFVSSYHSFYSIDTVMECTGLEYKEVSYYLKVLVNIYLVEYI